MKKRRKLMRTIYLDVEQIERLRKLSAKTRVPQAVYIRDGLDLVLNIHSEKIGSSPIFYGTGRGIGSGLSAWKILRIKYLRSWNPQALRLMSPIFLLFASMIAVFIGYIQ